MEQDLGPYAVLGIFILIAIMVPLGMLGISRLGGLFQMRPSRPSFRKRMAYESGMKPYDKRPSNYNFGYYAYAVLFVIFDVEVLLLYPFALRYGVLSEEFGVAALVSLAVFLFLVTVPFVYAWRKGYITLGNRS